MFNDVDFLEELQKSNNPQYRPDSLGPIDEQIFNHSHHKKKRKKK
jgi:hypothetical protein